MSRESAKLIDMLGIKGKRINIVPTNNGLNLVELYHPKESMDTGYMGAIVYDKRWKKYVLADLHNDFQMSRDCLNEAFDMVEEYWKKKV